jgi:hypothetical protein
MAVIGLTLPVFDISLEGETGNAAATVLVLYFMAVSAVVFFWQGDRQGDKNLTKRDNGLIMIKYLNPVMFLAGWPLWMVCQVPKLVRFLLRFFWYFLKIIHHFRRVLCAVDGTLGGLAAYFLFASPGMPLISMMLLVIFGGFLGAGMGILNWNLISVRWLKVHEAAPAFVRKW